ncbi:MAG: metal-dependent transcriptional regulator [Bacilli bacterium]|jgi:Mn-dependent DtxR family transcriptional regulator|nr:metal-dependent transcriptional regulator [Bacilli bacterium]MCH4278350.1 metal-dependent transcriptional regulator [Bacilli bacterium]
MDIYESGEDYLERILMLSLKEEKVHAVEVAKELNVSKPSVSVALKKLREGGYLEVGDDESLVLTPKGRSVAEKVYDRHKTLTSLLIKLGVDKDTAEKDACKVEHDLSDETFDLLKKHLEKHLE